MKCSSRLHSTIRHRVVRTIALGLLSGFTTQLLAEQRLYSNQFLFYGQSIVEPNCRFRLIMQRDGNLVVYNDQNRPLWASDTVGAGAFAIMQSDGNFVMYNWSGRPVWATGTWGRPGSYLAMQSDGNLVVYNGSTPLWASNTVVGGERYGQTPCAASSITATEPDWDRPGGDYIAYYMSAAQYSHCAYWCSQDGRCKAFTYVPPGVQGNAPMCWLKDRIPAASYRPGMVSGYIFR